MIPKDVLWQGFILFLEQINKIKDSEKHLP